MVVVLRRIALGALLLMGVFASVTLTTISRGEAAMALSDRAFDEGQVERSVGFAERAATAYVPGAPHVRAAHERLRAIAVGAEASGHPDVARVAWEASRAALLETRHAWQPHAKLLRRADENLARLLAGSTAEHSSAPSREQLGAVLAENPAPRTGIVVLLLAGFALAMAGVAFLALGAVTPAGGLRPARARVAVLLTVLGVACWTIAVHQA